MKSKHFNDRQNYMIRKSIHNYLNKLNCELDTIKKQKESLQKEIYERTSEIIQAQIDDIHDILECARFMGK